jgi:hypothetical protein
MLERVVMVVREGLWALICDVVVVEERLGACTWRDLGFLLVPRRRLLLSMFH